MASSAIAVDVLEAAGVRGAGLLGIPLVTRKRRGKASLGVGRPLLRLLRLLRLTFLLGGCTGGNVWVEVCGEIDCVGKNPRIQVESIVHVQARRGDFEMVMEDGRMIGVRDGGKA